VYRDAVRVVLSIAIYPLSSEPVLLTAGSHAVNKLRRPICVEQQSNNLIKRLQLIE